MSDAAVWVEDLTRAFGDFVAVDRVSFAVEPSEVFGFLARGLLQRIAGQRVARHQRLALIQRLGTDFAHVIDPHQGGGVAALGVFEHRVGNILARHRPHGLCRRKHRAKGAVEFDDGPIDHGRTPREGSERGSRSRLNACSRSRGGTRPSQK